MKEIKKALQQRLSQKNLGQISIGAFLLHHVRKKSNAPECLTGYLKRQKFTIDLPPADDKTKRYMNRIQLLDELNEKLEEAGYDYRIKEVRVF